MTAYMGKPATTIRARISAARFGSSWVLNIARISAALASIWQRLFKRQARKTSSGKQALHVVTVARLRG